MEIIIPILIVVAIIWWRLQRKTPLSQYHLPEADQIALQSLVPLCRHLPATLETLYYQKVARFIDEIYFKGYDGIIISHELKLKVAGHACLLTLKRVDKDYKKLHSVHIIPESFQQEMPSENGNYLSEVNGVSFENGKIVLAWNATVLGAKNTFDGHNVALHEFSHQFDQEDGDADGVPSDLPIELYGKWSAVMKRGFDKIQKRSRKKRRQLIDPYAATNPAEFFAVLTETFFEKGKHLKRKEPELYDLMKEYYGLDPAGWTDKAK